MGTLLQTAVYSLARPVVALVLGGTVLWQVATHVDSSRGQAVVHVMSTGVFLFVDDDTYRIDDLAQSPIVCELRPGHHTLRLIRDGELLHEEDFVMVAGEDTVLALCAPPRRRDEGPSIASP